MHPVSLINAPRAQSGIPGWYRMKSTAWRRIKLPITGSLSDP